MKIEARTLKGFRDFLPKETAKRQYVLEKLKGVFESYGFERIETPTLEYEDILLGKYGDEGDKLMYRFEDNGQRRVALRYDQTVPLARFFAQNQNNIPIPFKRYQIQNVFRAENTQKGRFREFLQVDFDIVSEKSIGADFEILQVVNESLKSLGFQNYKILINDRKNFEGIDPQAILIIDKLKKIGEEKVRSELRENGFDENLLETIKSKPQTDLIKIILQNSYLSPLTSHLTYDPTLARGLDYYTGLIVEVEIEGFTAGSVGGGGRYDNLIGIFQNENIPAVGFSFGFDRLIEAMDEKNLFPGNLSAIKVLVTVPSIELEEVSIKAGALLRQSNINTDVYLNNEAPLEKQFKYAEKKEIPYVLVPKSENIFEIRNKDANGDIVKEELNFENLVTKLTAE